MLRSLVGSEMCIRDRLYPDANIFVVSHFPRLFEHLSCPVFNYDQWKGMNDAVITMYTCPDEDKSEHKMSHVMFHPIDFASMSMIKRTIPNNEKTIKLKLEAEDTMSVLNLLDGKKKDKPTVVVHSGKWWPSKTLPQD